MNQSTKNTIGAWGLIAGVLLACGLVVRLTHGPHVADDQWEPRQTVRATDKYERPPDVDCEIVLGFRTEDTVKRCGWDQPTTLGADGRVRVIRPAPTVLRGGQ